MKVQERILRYRVEQQNNDPVRNPDHQWRLIYSTNDPENAYQYADQLRVDVQELGDQVRVRDAGSETVVVREVY